MRIIASILVSAFASFSFAQSTAPALTQKGAQGNTIQEPKPMYTADIAKEEKKLSKKEKAKLKKMRAPRKAETQPAKVATESGKSLEEQIKDTDRSDLSSPE